MAKKQPTIPELFQEYLTISKQITELESQKSILKSQLTSLIPPNSSLNGIQYKLSQVEKVDYKKAFDKAIALIPKSKRTSVISSITAECISTYETARISEEK